MNENSNKLSVSEIRTLAANIRDNAWWFDEAHEMKRMEWCYQASAALFEYAAMKERLEEKLSNLKLKQKYEA